MRILVTPEILNNLARQINQGAVQLRDVDGQLGRALGSLDWDSRQKIGMDKAINSARQQACQLSEQTELLARFLIERAQIFEQTDQEMANHLGAFSSQYQQINISVPWAQVDQVGQRIRKIIDLGEMLHQSAATVIVGASMIPGTAYAGEVIINIPDWLKSIEGLREIREFAYLPGQLNHFALATLPSEMLATGIAISIPIIVGKLSTDLVQYKGTDLASAAIVDTAFTLAPVVASYGITVGCAALGTILFPGPGTAAGIAAGSFIAGNAASIAFQWELGKDSVRDTAITVVDHSLQSVTDSIQVGYQQFSRALP